MKYLFSHIIIQDLVIARSLIPLTSLKLKTNIIYLNPHLLKMNKSLPYMHHILRKSKLRMTEVLMKDGQTWRRSQKHPMNEAYKMVDVKQNRSLKTMKKLMW